MPLKCAALECRKHFLNESDTPYFKLPKDKILQSAWIRQIHRKKWKPGKNSILCIKHFYESDLLYTQSYTDKFGEKKERNRKKPLLAVNAIPFKFTHRDILPQQLRIEKERKEKERVLSEIKERLETEMKSKQRMENEKKQRLEDQINKNKKIQDEIESDRIISFQSLLSNYKCKLSNVMNKWRVTEREDFMLFYIIDCIADVPAVKVSIKIDSVLDVRVCSNGKILEINKKVTKWSKLISLIKTCEQNTSVVISVLTESPN